MNRKRYALSALILAGGPCQSSHNPDSLQKPARTARARRCRARSLGRRIELVQGDPVARKGGLNIVAVQNPLTSLERDLAATKRTIARQDRPVILVGHSWAGVVITEAGADPKFAGLVYVAAFAREHPE